MDREELLRRILKEISDGKEPVQAEYDLDLQQWGEIAELVKDAGLAEGVTIQRGGFGNKIVFAWYRNPRITINGLAYLKS